jgi:hypothetical protein
LKKNVKNFNILFKMDFVTYMIQFKMNFFVLNEVKKHAYNFGQTHFEIL